MPAVTSAKITSEGRTRLVRETVVERTSLCELARAIGGSGFGGGARTRDYECHRRQFVVSTFLVF